MDSDFSLIDLFLHLDKHLAIVIQDYGVWTYAILFMIVLCETGLVVTPFLPGDSLLFAAGALSSQGGMNVHLLAGLLLIAAVVGDAINYSIGAYLGPKAFQNPKSKIFRKEYLEITQRYYERYGASTIIIARFAPIVRTFAPFLAGMGEMNYGKFALYNVTGATLWVGLLTYAGYFFGNLAIVKNNFSIVVLGIVALSVLIPVLKFLKEKKSSGHATTNTI